MSTETIAPQKKLSLKGGRTVSEINIGSKELLKAINTVTPAIESSSIVPALSNVLLKIENGEAEFTGTNLKQTIVHRIPHTEMFVQAKMLLPATLLSRLLKTLPDTPIVIRHVTREQNDSTGKAFVAHIISIECGGNFYSLESEDPEFFTSEIKMVDPVEITVNGDVLRNGLFFTKDCQADAKHPNAKLIGVNVKISEGKITILATNGQLMAKYDSAVDYDGKSKTFTLPAKSVDILTELSGEEIRVTIGQNSVQFSNETTSVISQLITERYPDTSSFESITWPNKYVIDTAELKVSIARAQIVSKNSLARMELNERLTIIVENTESGCNEEVGIMSQEGNADSLGFNLSLLGLLASKLSGGTIQLETNGIRMPVIITHSIDSNLSMLMMPFVA